MNDRQTTHAPGCWDWGPEHYECALRGIERVLAELKRVSAAKGKAKARADGMEKALKDIRSLSSINAMNQNPFTLAALLAEIHHIADTALAKEKDNEQ